MPTLCVFRKLVKPLTMMFHLLLRIFIIAFILICLTLFVKGLIDEKFIFPYSNDEEPDGLINSWLITIDSLLNIHYLLGNDETFINCTSNIPDRFLFDRIKISWLCSALASIIVAFTGVIPAIFLSNEPNTKKKREGERNLNRLLSFAVGTLLGEVFLHILPETWRYAANGRGHSRHWGMWVIFGSVLCFLVEKCASGAEDSKHKAAAFVNLCANAIDNFTHGLAVGAGFSVGVKFGVLTTFAILIHEIPHEISDFAILLRADFDRWSAIKAQLITATGGVLGASVALMANNDLAGLEHKAASWILPFTAGGFLNVALVQVLPDLLKEKSLTESAMQIVYIGTGVGLMGLVNAFHT